MRLLSQQGVLKSLCVKHLRFYVSAIRLFCEKRRCCVRAIFIWTAPRGFVCASQYNRGRLTLYSVLLRLMLVLCDEFGRERYQFGVLT